MILLAGLKPWLTIIHTVYYVPLHLRKQVAVTRWRKWNFLGTDYVSPACLLYIALLQYTAYNLIPPYIRARSSVVERLPFKESVIGSIPIGLTKKSSYVS